MRITTGSAPIAADRDLLPITQPAEMVGGAASPSDTAPPTDAFAARSAPPVPLCASPYEERPIPLTIGTTECSLEASPDYDTGIANLCSPSGRGDGHRATNNAGSGKADLTMVPLRVLVPSLLSRMGRTGRKI